MATSDSKLIFAPAGSKTTGQASQFTKGLLHRTDLDPSSPLSQFHTWFSQAQQHAAETDSSAHPETCILSTAHLPSGRVSSRAVYLKELDATTPNTNRPSSSSSSDTTGHQSKETSNVNQPPGHFVIYSNLAHSRKAADLATNPHASLLFHWPELQRQVRVEGRSERHSRKESQAYFDTRARGSRIGAWASRQSQVLEPLTEQTQTQEQARGQLEGEQGKEGAEDDGRAQLERWVKEAEEKFEGQDKIPVPDFWGGLRIIPDRLEFWQGRDSRLHDRFVYEWVEGENRWKLERLSP